MNICIIHESALNLIAASGKSPDEGQTWTFIAATFALFLAWLSFANKTGKVEHSLVSRLGFKPGNFTDIAHFGTLVGLLIWYVFLLREYYNPAVLLLAFLALVLAGEHIKSLTESREKLTQATEKIEDYGVTTGGSFFIDQMRNYKGNDAIDATILHFDFDIIVSQFLLNDKYTAKYPTECKPSDKNFEDKNFLWRESNKKLTGFSVNQSHDSLVASLRAAIDVKPSFRARIVTSLPSVPELPAEITADLSPHTKEQCSLVARRILGAMWMRATGIQAYLAHFDTAAQLLLSSAPGAGTLGVSREAAPKPLDIHVAKNPIWIHVLGKTIYHVLPKKGNQTISTVVRIEPDGRKELEPYLASQMLADRYARELRRSYESGTRLLPWITDLADHANGYTDKPFGYDEYWVAYKKWIVDSWVDSQLARSEILSLLGSIKPGVLETQILGFPTTKQQEHLVHTICDYYVYAERKLAEKLCCAVNLKTNDSENSVAPNLSKLTI